MRCPHCGHFSAKQWSETFSVGDHVMAVYGGPIGRVVSTDDGWTTVQYPHGSCLYKHGRDGLYPAPAGNSLASIRPIR